jgi:hypothetical protein
MGIYEAADFSRRQIGLEIVARAQHSIDLLI